PYDGTPTSSTAFSTFLPERSRTAAYRLSSLGFSTTPRSDARCDCCRQRLTDITATQAACSSTRSAWQRSAGRLHNCIHDFVSIFFSARRSCTTSDERPSFDPVPPLHRRRKASCSDTCTSACG